MRRIEIPGRAPLELSHLLLDVNGTLTLGGELLDGVEERLDALRGRMRVCLLSADTFGSLGRVAERLGVNATRVADGAAKASVVRELGAHACAAVGNGANDAAMLAAAALGIAVVGPEGASVQTTAAADIVCRSICEALDLLADERALAATLRP